MTAGNSWYCQLVYTCCTVVQSVFITSGSADTVKTRLHAGTLKDRHEQPLSGGVPATIYKWCVWRDGILFTGRIPSVCGSVMKQLHYVSSSPHIKMMQGDFLPTSTHSYTHPCNAETDRQTVLGDIQSTLSLVPRPHRIRLSSRLSTCMVSVVSKPRYTFLCILLERKSLTKLEWCRITTQ